MISVLCYIDGKVETHEGVQPEWLKPDSGRIVWVDFSSPTPDEAKILGTAFSFHDLAVEDALTTMHYPKVESYEHYLYLILHGIDFEASQHSFATHDTDFFFKDNVLVTVHDGRTRSVPEVRALAKKNPHIMQEGAFALAHRVIDRMVDHYRPEVDELADELDALERKIFEAPSHELIRDILELKRDVASLRRVVLPQRDVVSRLARREFSLITDAIAYRFRDVYDHLVRLSDEAVVLHDRISNLLEAHLSSASNRLNQVMKVLTLFSTVFMPLTVLTGVFGMNVQLPTFPGGAEMQFWWIAGLMTLISGGMLWFFYTRKWF